MKYFEHKTLEEQVNTRGTKLWTMMNDNSKSEKQRNKFVAENGGFFTREGRYWKWTSAIDENNGYWLKRVDTGEKVFFESMTEFGKNNGLTPVKICELLNGKRKTYNGWEAVEIRPVKEDVGSYEKIQKPKKKKVAVGKSVIFLDMTTNQTVPVSNLFQFAKQNNLDYDCIKKLAKGKMKTYKNLKIYNPLEIYKDSSEPK